MNRIASTGRGTIFLLWASGFALAQSSSAVATPTAISVSATATGKAQDAAGRALVIYARGQLAITANRSSLHEILLEIGRQTGMKITGTVEEERVFGSYGPATASAVLSSLLCGTGSNMQLKETASGTPEELILTPRPNGLTSGVPEMPTTAAAITTAASSQPMAQPAATSGTAVGPGTMADTASQASPTASKDIMTFEQRQQFIQQLQQQQQSGWKH